MPDWCMDALDFEHFFFPQQGLLLFIGVGFWNAVQFTAEGVRKASLRCREAQEACITSPPDGHPHLTCGHTCWPGRGQVGLRMRSIFLHHRAQLLTPILYLRLYCQDAFSDSHTQGWPQRLLGPVQNKTLHSLFKKQENFFFLSSTVSHSTCHGGFF